jgi:hypothetical protein
MTALDDFLTQAQSDEVFIVEEPIAKTVASTEEIPF